MERTENICLKLEINYGGEREFVLISDSKSTLSRVITDNGMCSRGDISMEEVSKIKEYFLKKRARLLFITDEWNLGDLCTKYWPHQSEKMVSLLRVMETGLMTLPIRAFMGRMK